MIDGNDVYRQSEIGEAVANARKEETAAFLARIC